MDIAVIEIEEVDVDAMRAAIKYFIGTHDFMAFCGNKYKAASRYS